MDKLKSKISPNPDKMILNPDKMSPNPDKRR